jgi:uncharacterized protein YpuA (DUF1002 family)
MTPEQKVFWDTLKCDVHWFAHDRARILSRLDDEEFHKTVDDLMIMMANNLTASDISSVIKTWLSIYNLPLDAGRLGPGFEQVHNRIVHYVQREPNKIKVVELT